MKKRIGRLVAAFVAAAICIAPAAVSQARPSENVPAPNAASVQPPPPPASSSSNDILFYDTEREIALAYLRSAERIQRYESDYEKASVLIASAIDSGYFATTSKRYNANKEPRQDWYAGPGGISTPFERASAWLYWNADGSINYKKGIDSFTLTNGHATVKIVKSDLGDGPYLGSLQQGPRGYEYMISPEFMKDPVLADENQLFPWDQTDLVLRDTEVRRALDLMMAAAFRTTDWCNLVLR